MIVAHNILSGYVAYYSALYGIAVRTFVCVLQSFNSNDVHDTPNEKLSARLVSFEKHRA